MSEKNAEWENLMKLKRLFPEVVEGEAIDCDRLLGLFGKYSGRYNSGGRFIWRGKEKACQMSEEPARGRLRLLEGEESDNLYIEGDNLEVLKLLRKDYGGKIRLIYIDPPYNKDKTFVFADRWRGEGDRHTEWLNMIYPRLCLAQKLLSEDGVIMISIDEAELANMKQICDEIFGEENFVEFFLWTKTSTPPSLYRKSRKVVEFILCYERAKSKRRYYGSKLENGDAPLINSGNPVRELTFPAGVVRVTFMEKGSFAPGSFEKAELLTGLEVCGGRNKAAFTLKGAFKWNGDMLAKEIEKGTAFLIKSMKFSIRFQRAEDKGRFKPPMNLLDIELNKEHGVGTNESAAKELAELGMEGLFDYPKPVSLVKKLIKMTAYDDKDCTVLDFFSGSGTTAQAVMELNAEDGGKRRFIMVQHPEECGGEYKNICEIGKERIRRAGERIGSAVDVGFKVLRLEERE